MRYNSSKEAYRSNRLLEIVPFPHTVTMQSFVRRMRFRKKSHFFAFAHKSVWPYNKMKYPNLLSNLQLKIWPRCQICSVFPIGSTLIQNTRLFFTYLHIPWLTMIDIKLGLCYVICVRCFTLNWANDVIVANRRIHWKMTGAKIPWLNNFWWANTDYYHFPRHLKSLIPSREAFLVRSQLWIACNLALIIEE